MTLPIYNNAVTDTSDATDILNQGIKVYLDQLAEAVEERLAALESTVTDLEARIVVLESAP